MEFLSEALDFLSWATKAVNAVRALLADLNVPLPAVIAQGLGLAVLALLAVYLVQGARRRAGSRLARLAQGVGALAAGVAGLAIVHAWIDDLVTPPSRQVVGTVEGAAIATVRIELLDYRGEPLGATVDKDTERGFFAISYAPEFADPPSAVAVSAKDCADQRRITLRRAQLKAGAPVGVRLECGGAG